MKIVLAESNREDLGNTAELIRNVFKNDFKCTIFKAASEDELLSFLNKKGADILILNLLFPESDKGITLFRNLRKRYLQTIIIPVIPVERDDLIKIVLQLDAFFYIKKPYDSVQEPCSTRKASTVIFESL